MQTEATSPRTVLTTAELAARWQLHPRTLVRLVNEGTFPVKPLPLMRGKFVFPLAAVEAVERGETA